MNDKIKNYAFIGIGPRGLHALECYLTEYSCVYKEPNFHINLIEATGCFGNGQVYDVDQNASNWFNISKRGLILDGRATIKLVNIVIPPFPSYHEWIGEDYSEADSKLKDEYPLRGNFGSYLQARFNSISEPLLAHNLISLHTDKIDHVVIEPNGDLTLHTDKQVFNRIDEILLTIGHQPTETSEQIEKWTKLTQQHSNLTFFKSPYPVNAIVDKAEVTKTTAIGIRGFGLAMIDVTRAIATQYGQFIFEDKSETILRYKQSHSDLPTPLLIPFSLDGLPMSPKPFNAEIDGWFQPSNEQLAVFKAKIGNQKNQQNATGSSFLIDAITPIIANIYLQLSNNYDCKFDLESLISTAKHWLNDADYKDELIIGKSLTPLETMQQFAAMAMGKNTISLDYCIGQIWRHCQPTMYEALSFHACEDDAFAKIIALDERMKRYAYGPPVESIQQLLALAKARFLTLNFISDPEITTSENGWKLSKNEENVTVKLMVDSVLDSPQLKKVDSPLINQLKADDLIQPVHDDLSISTDDNAYLISKNQEKEMPIALLGRLAKGTVIGVDAILECFGERPKIWAKEAVKRYNK